MTEELLAEPNARRWKVIASLLFGSMLAWGQIRRVGDYLQPTSCPYPWGYIPQGSHRDIFGNRGLWPRSEAELAKDEVLLGVLDATIGFRYFAFLPWCMSWWLASWLLIELFIGGSLRDAAGAGAGMAMALVLRRVTHSAFVAVAVTSHGVVIFRRKFFIGRTGKMIERMPPVDPKLLKGGSVLRKVQMGQRRLWLESESDPLLYWMSNTLRSTNAP